jgi:hypothetical protein
MAADAANKVLRVRQSLWLMADPTFDFRCSVTPHLLNDKQLVSFAFAIAR